MPDDKLQISIFDFVTSIARVIGLMSPAVGNHNLQVAYLSYRIGEALDMSIEEKNDLLIAGALHDVGAFSLKEWTDLLEFEDRNPGMHSMAGYLLLKDFKPFAPISEIIRYHHVPWKTVEDILQKGKTVPTGSHILYLSDRVAVMISKDEPVLGQVDRICETIMGRKNEEFAPDLVDVMIDLAKHDYIWMELTSDSLETILQRRFLNRIRELAIDELLDFALMICKLIDFKSEFTATHSSGVAATAVEIAKSAGFSKYEQKLVKIAAYLHDLGKIAIPSEILEKKHKLTDDEWHIMRSHAYYTYQILEPIDTLGIIWNWGALHQERLNGTGYPFGLKVDELPLGTRIMSVADVFTAIAEDRPYRKGMDKRSAINVLESMATNDELDKNIVDILLEHFDEINDIRETAQKEAVREFEAFQNGMNTEGW